MSTAEQAAERESRSIVAAQPAVATRPLVHRWYLGGLASATAAACTHPLDLLKVHLQTQQEVRRGLWGMAVRVVRTQGVIGLYCGLTASISRQLTYSTTRFGVYEILKARLLPADGFTHAVLLVHSKNRTFRLLQAFVRLGPQTILTFIFLEKLRIIFPPKS